jgi:hypothetical protein
MHPHIPQCAAYYKRKFKEAVKHHHKRALVMTGKSVGLAVGLLHRNEPFRSRQDQSPKASNRPPAGIFPGPGVGCQSSILPSLTNDNCDEGCDGAILFCGLRLR